MSQLIKVTLALVVIETALLAGEPAGYYNSAIGFTGPALKQALHDIIDNHTVIQYSGPGFDTRSAVDALQTDPNNASNVILVYSGFSVPKSTWPNYNREHLWPQSLGTSSGAANSDIHNLYACDANVNTLRSNRAFGDCVSGCSVPSEAPLVRYNSQIWEPRDVEKGDLARALFYMAVRYEGDTGGEPDLELTNGSAFTGCNCMAVLDTLIEWHTDDPVDAVEEIRNDMIYGWQNNRNPNVDNPQLVYDIWGGGPITPDPEIPSPVFFNEIHYNNGGPDLNEGFEIAGPAGTSLNGWVVYGYDGTTQTPYDQITLSGTIPDQQNGFGTLWFSWSNIENGPDGLALVDDQGEVFQWISYQGAFEALTGPVAGLTSANIGVAESGATSSTESLQRIGTGEISTDFDWSAPAPQSQGLVNTGQTLTPLSSPEDPSVVWINELHYNNGGPDLNEGVEIAGPAGLSLAGYSLIAYDGLTGDPYDVRNLSGALPDDQNGYGTLWFAWNNLENGAPDGIAFVDSQGEVIHFLSYQGAFTASSGAAAGLLSTDIGVSESGSTGPDESLQRIGAGSFSTDFVWTGPTTQSLGEINASQIFLAAGGLFQRGDCNGDGSTNIADALAGLNYLFSGGTVGCLDACDSDDTGAVQINDPLIILNFQFTGGPPPAAPFGSCGSDSGASVGCDDYLNCP